MNDYPAPPWRMHGDGWLSLFRLADAADEHHPAGVYTVGFIDYTEPSPLTYGELLVARPVSAGSTTGGRRGRAVTVTDMWVDSPASVAGGRTLWGFPKVLCTFEHGTGRRGPLTRTRWAAEADGRPLVEARFTDVSRAAPRVPTKGRVEQPGIDDHPEPGRCRMTGSAKSLPCRARWDFPADGPLAWLRRARQLGSFAMKDFRLEFE